MGYALFLASETADSNDIIGHCWVSVEYPKGCWTVRGFYPAGGQTVRHNVLFGQPGLIKDDFETTLQEAKSSRLRSRTFRNLSQASVKSALAKIFEYGGSYRRGLMKKNRNGSISYMPRDRQGQASRYNYTFVGDLEGDAQNYSFIKEITSGPYSHFKPNQCAVFAIEVCKAAGVNPVPFIPQAPIAIWNWLDINGGLSDARRLPRPFGTGPS